MSGVLSTIAAGLRGDTTDILALRVDQVCLRTLSMLRSSSPMLEKSLTVCLPLVLLGVGIWQHVVVFMKLTSGLQQAYSSFLCRLTIPGTHRLNRLVRAYLIQNGIGQDTRSLAIEDFHPEDSDDVASAPKYLPAPATDAWFKFNGNWLRFTRNLQAPPNGHVTRFPDVTLACISFTGNVDPIKSFLDHLEVSTKARKQPMIEIIRHSPGRENRITASIFRPSRKLDSVSMNAAKKNEMIADMTAYLASETWYADRGIPWRRGYLLYGPPGTGKTSIATAIAGHFDIPLVIIGLSLPGMNDSSLQSAFDRLPHRCVVLLEDLDSAGIGRERTTTTSKAIEGQDNTSFADDTFSSRGGNTVSSGITLSGLLNACDGPASHEGRILLCTTNSPDSLDPALLRPGRIDMKILFGNATAEVTECLFLHIFENTTDQGSCCEVAQLARKFAALVPDDQLTPAEIQNFLLQHRDDPFKALDDAELWVQNTLVAKNSGGNVASFKGQI